eukprot:8689695-Pyramimonas_sp.AAC.1
MSLPVSSTTEQGKHETSIPLSSYPDFQRKDSSRSPMGEAASSSFGGAMAEVRVGRSPAAWRRRRRIAAH